MKTDQKVKALYMENINTPTIWMVCTQNVGVLMDHDKNVSRSL